MYDVDERDRAVRISGFPPPEAGAPYPRVAAGDRSLQLAYRCLNTTLDRGNDTIAVVTFALAVIHLFGSYASHNNLKHPLFARGLQLYGAFAIENSSLLRALQRIRAAGPDSTHYILTFHDSIFECVAREFSVETRPAAGVEATLSFGYDD
jgi:hypothetical protein